MEEEKHEGVCEIVEEGGLAIESNYCFFWQQADPWIAGDERVGAEQHGGTRLDTIDASTTSSPASLNRA